MNIIKMLTERVEEDRKETKNPCKNYATEAAAERATQAAAQKVADHFYWLSTGRADPANYIIVYIESWGRWVGFIDMSEVLRRSTSSGGYMGVETGFYKF